MSKDYWQTRKQIKQLSYGKTLTSKINAYVEMWEKRCYFDGIPDGEELPPKLLNSHKVPSWKKIALCILNNDHHLRGIGFESEENELTEQLKLESKRNKDITPDQMSLFEVHGMH